MVYRIFSVAGYICFVKMVLPKKTAKSGKGCPQRIWDWFTEGDIRWRFCDCEEFVNFSLRNTILYTV